MRSKENMTVASFYITQEAAERLEKESKLLGVGKSEIVRLAIARLLDLKIDCSKKLADKF